MKKIMFMLMLILPQFVMGLEIKSGYVAAHTEMLMDKTIDPRNDSLHADITMQDNDITSIRGKFWVEAALFTSDKKDRDEHMYKEMQTDKFSLATYTVKNVKKTERNDGYTLEGELDFHGVKKELDADAKISLKDGTLVLEADTKILVSDYGIEMPCMVFMCVRDQVDLHVKAEF